MQQSVQVEVAIIGSGIAGISTAYYLCREYGYTSILLIDSRDPLSYTTAQSGDNYRNWWPSDVMTSFTDHSIDLMVKLARDSSNELQLKQRGYAVATRQSNIDNLMQPLQRTYKNRPDLLRIHTNSSNYVQSHPEHWSSGPSGVDVLSKIELIQEIFPSFSPDIKHVLHIRRAGDFSSQQMGQDMLQRIKPLGVRRLRGRVTGIDRGAAYSLEIKQQMDSVTVQADIVINAAGPFVDSIAEMIGSKLPVENIYHQKLAFEDVHGAIPRDMPFSIDLDETTLTWSDEERGALEQEENLSWLTRPITGGIHCRPEGSGRWVKLGWAYNRSVSTTNYDAPLTEDEHHDDLFPEIVIRAAASLNPALNRYIDELPTRRTHYGGYYTMTKENLPLIGPLDDQATFVVGGLSGFGCMSACAAGFLCASWVAGKSLPDYAEILSPSRYKNAELISSLRQQATGLL